MGLSPQTERGFMASGIFSRGHFLFRFGLFVFRLVLLSGLLLLSSASSFAQAAGPAPGWRALLVSGGGVPSSNAVAHEKNLLFVERVLAKRGVDKANVTMHAGPGPGQARDVSYIGEFPPHRWELFLLDRLFGHGGVELSYRPHRLSRLESAARRADVLGAVGKAVASLESGETLFLYTTDHGIRGEGSDEDNALVLWGDELLTVADMRELLARVRHGRVVLAMSQCFSGAFADVIFPAGDTNATGPDVCGFFAAPPDRVAAGCTPELNEAEYDDYTTRLFAALGGVERTGRRAPATDYDRDGRVSLAEAHAYAVGSDDTVDVPLRTSEHYLRRVGVPVVASWEQAVSGASPEDLAAWKMLRIRLALKPGDPRAVVAERLAGIDGERERIGRQIRSIDAEAAGYEAELRIALLEQWPMLDSPFHPDFASVLSQQNDRIRGFLLKDASYRALNRVLESMNTLYERLAVLETEEAWWLRARRLASHMLRVASLEKEGPWRDGFNRLQACERTALPR